MCKSTPFMTFVSRSNQSGYNFRPDCNRWSCAECRTKLEEDWSNHASFLFTACFEGVGYLCVPDDRVAATLKRLARAGAQYIRVRGHGIFHIYTSNKDLGQKFLTSDQAKDLFAEHIALAPSGNGHVISTSRGWRHARRGEEGRPGDAICVATGVGPEVIRSILDRLNQTSSITAGVLNFRFDAKAIMEAFVQAAEAACPNCSMNSSKRVSVNSDRTPTAASGRRRFVPNPLFEALRSP